MIEPITVNSRYNEVLGTYKFLRYNRIIINKFSTLGGNLHFVIFDLVITEVYCLVVTSALRLLGRFMTCLTQTITASR